MLSQRLGNSLIVPTVPYSTVTVYWLNLTWPIAGSVTFAGPSFGWHRQGLEYGGWTSLCIQRKGTNIGHRQGNVQLLLCNTFWVLRLPRFHLQFLLRVCFSLEGHSLWIPTQTYDDIVSCPPVNRGKKSRTFAVPSKYWDGLPGTQGQVSIQAAFRCPDWTLLFIDHNVMITFHIMGLQNSCKREDLMPGSLVRNFICR